MIANIVHVIDIASYAIHFLFSTLISYAHSFFAARKVYQPDAKHYVLVTGTSTGIGNHAANHLASIGYTVIATVRKQEDAKKIQTSRIIPIIMDVGQDDSVKKGLEEVKRIIKDNSGILVAIVNNAGITSMLPAECQKLEDVKGLFEVNVFGVLRVTQGLLPLLRESKGRVVIVGSIAGRLSIAGTSSYSMSKFAMEAYADSLRQEMAPFGVSVSLLEPGMIESEILKKGIEKTTSVTSKLPYELKEIYSGVIDATFAHVDMVTKFGIGPEATSRAILSAIQSPFPMSRYVVGLDAGIVKCLMHLPDFVRDFMVHLASQNKK